MIPPRERLVGAILGTAVGDAIGLPCEGMSRRRVRRMRGAPLHHRLVFGRGMTSDDTEHTCMAAQALLAAGGDPHRFARSLAWRLRWWLLGLPAGVGKATALGTLKLWIGFPPGRSGVRSAGNGPAMRTAVLGVYAAGRDVAMLLGLVRASTRLTHTDPRAEQGALAVALAARYAAQRDAGDVRPDAFLDALRPHVRDVELWRLAQMAAAHAAGCGTADGLTAELGLTCGVSGFVYHSVPVALFCWLRWPGDLRSAVEAAVLAGGDTDTTAAIAGALVGATTGADGIPGEWLGGLAEWPRTVSWMRRLGERLADASAGAQLGPLPLFWPGLIARNVAFLAIVLAHGLRRLLPPY